MKKIFTIPLVVIVIMLVSFVFITVISGNQKLDKLKLSGNSVEFYPSETGRITVIAENNIDSDKLQIKSKDINVKKEICTKTDLDYECVLAFSGFKSASEKVEIKYGDQLFYINAKIKSLDKLPKNMSSDEKYQVALARLLTKYKVTSTDDIKDEKLRLKVEDQIEKLKDKY